jgi:hypothetical protein
LANRLSASNANGLPVPLENGATAECPKEGGVYTIRDFIVVEGLTGLLLDEVRNPPSTWSNGDVRELAFPVHRFRPKKATDLHRAKRGVAVLVTCIIQTMNETDPTFQERCLKRMSDAYYEVRDNYDGRWDGEVNQELELLSWTRELLTGWNFVTGQGNPFLER